GQSVVWNAVFWKITKDVTLDEFKLDKKFLQLKPLSSISDEDAIEVAKIYVVLEKNETSEVGKTISSKFEKPSDMIYAPTWSGKNWLIVSDYLRSKGYALPFMGISVEQMIEWNWIKLNS